MNNKEKNFISAVIYVYNDEKTIRYFLNKLIDLFEKNFEHSEIVCVNDCSSDNSVNIIKEVSKIAKSTSVSIINMSYFYGVEAAMSAGVEHSIGDFVLEFDSPIVDYDIDEIMSCYNHSLKGFDIVSVCPDKKQRFSSSIFYYIINKLTGIKMFSERFCILSRRAINRISSMNKEVPYRKIIYSNCGLKKDNLYYQVKFNEKINSDKNRKYRKELAIDSLILFTNFGYSFSAGMTIVMMLMAFVMLVYTIIIFFTGTPAEGWTTIITFMSLCFFGLFAILTIIIKYLQILINLVFKRKKYNFESIEKLTT